MQCRVLLVVVRGLWASSWQTSPLSVQLGVGRVGEPISWGMQGILGDCWFGSGSWSGQGGLFWTVGPSECLLQPVEYLGRLSSAALLAILGIMVSREGWPCVYCL